MPRDVIFEEAPKPSLERLAYILRHRELWPSDFEWDWQKRGQCGGGLALRLWRQLKSDDPIDCYTWERDLMELFEITRTDVATLFEVSCCLPTLPMRPVDVAVRIDSFLFARRCTRKIKSPLVDRIMAALLN